MGYQTPIRADHINESGIITRQIVDLLIESDLVIADLSYRNPNVCYELAVRHVVKKPFIHMIRNGHKIPFDTASNRAITVDIDIRSANKAMEELESHISSIGSGDNEMDNPIGTALTLRDLKSSGDPSQMISADLMEAIQNIAAEVKALREPRPTPYEFHRVGGGGMITLTATQHLLAEQYNKLILTRGKLIALNAPQEKISKYNNEITNKIDQLRATGLNWNDLSKIAIYGLDFGTDYNSGTQ